MVPFSVTETLPTLTVALSLSLIFTVAGAVLAVIAGLLVAATIVNTTVSVGSTKVSSSTKTGRVTLVCPAGIVTVVPKVL
ncbi:hypothetical protein D3C87_715950 [compost metagenome]